MFEELQRTAEWFEKRKGRVTGSSVGAILCLCPWRKPEDVLRAMVRDHHGAESEFQGNPATDYGTRMEIHAKLHFEKVTGLVVDPVGFVTYSDWLGASPDGLIGDTAVLEIKCPFKFRKEPNPVFVSLLEQPHYYAQVQIEMLVTGRNTAYFVQYAPAYGDVFDADYREEKAHIVTVSRDEEWLDENLPKLKAFHDIYLSELDNPAHLEPLRVELNDDESLKILDQIGDLYDAIHNATEARKAAIDRLIDMAGGNDALIHGRKLTKVERKGSLQYAKLLKDHPIDVDLEGYRGKGSVSWRLS